MIRSIASRLNDLAHALRDRRLLDEIRSRAPVVTKPDFTIERAMRSMEQAAQALESVKVYAVARPLDWHEQDLYERSADYREDVAENLARKIAHGAFRDAVMQFDLVDTDREGVKAAMGQVAIVTHGSGVQFFTTQLEDAFAQGAEAMHQALLDGAGDIRNCTAQEGFARLLELIRSTKARRVSAPAHIQPKLDP